MKTRIKELRSSLGLTQQKFADRLGLKRQTIAAYEIGNIEPSDSTLLLMCKEFNVNEIWLRTGQGSMKPTVCHDNRYSINLSKLQRINDETIIRWVNTIAETNPVVLKQIEEFMKNLLNINTESDSAAIKKAEDEYIKSRSLSVQKTNLSVSNTIAEEKGKNETSRINSNRFKYSG